MVKTLCFRTNVMANREVRIVLPKEVPTGPADIVLTVASEMPAKQCTLGDFRRSRFFGMWRGRKDIRDSRAFARRLRAKAWARQE